MLDAPCLGLLCLWQWFSSLLLQSLQFILTTHFLSRGLSDPWTKSVPHQSKKSKYKDRGQDSGGPELVKKSNNGFYFQNCTFSFIFRTSEVPIPSSPGVKIPIPVRSSSPDDFEVNIINTHNTCNDVGVMTTMLALSQITTIVALKPQMLVY